MCTYKTEYWGNGTVYIQSIKQLHQQFFNSYLPKRCFQAIGVLLSSARTRVRVKLGLFNAKIRNENHRYIHRLIYKLNEQDLLCHSAQTASLISVTSLLDGGLKWANFDIMTVEKPVHLLCFGCVRRITFSVTCNVFMLIVLCSCKVSTL